MSEDELSVAPNGSNPEEDATEQSFEIEGIPFHYQQGDRRATFSQGTATQRLNIIVQPPEQELEASTDAKNLQEMITEHGIGFLSVDVQRLNLETQLREVAGFSIQHMNENEWRYLANSATATHVDSDIERPIDTIIEDIEITVDETGKPNDLLVTPAWWEMADRECDSPRAITLTDSGLESDIEIHPDSECGRLLTHAGLPTHYNNTILEQKKTIETSEALPAPEQVQKNILQYLKKSIFPQAEIESKPLLS